MCGQVGCTQVPPTEFWFPDNLPSEDDVRRHREQAEVETEERVGESGPDRPTADGYVGRARPRRARTGRRSRWPSEDRAHHGPTEDRGAR